MNFATPAVLLVLLFLPGVLVRATYLRIGWDSNPFRFNTITEEIAFSSFVSLFLHLVWVKIAHLTGYAVEFNSVIALLFGPGTGNDAFKVARENLSGHVNQISWYFGTLYTFSFLFGIALKWLVRALKVDRKCRFFRFQHPWHYLLSGEIVEFAKKADPSKPITSIVVAVEMNKLTYLYRGTLETVIFDEKGLMERIVLANPRRATLADIETFDAETEKQIDDKRKLNAHYPFHYIDGNFMVFFAKDILNMNVKYTRMVPATEEKKTLQSG